MTRVGGDMNFVNPVLLLILIAEVCLGLCAWLCPQCLRWVAAHLLTRADVIDVSRCEAERRMKYWLDELGLAREPLTGEDCRELPTMRRLARH